MKRRISRRQVLAAGLGAAVAGFAQGCGISGSSAVQRPNQTESTEGRAATATVRSTATPRPTSTPTATPTPPPPLERPSWGPATLRHPLYFVPTEQPVVALTIDDGESHLDEVLAVLVEHEVRATLFLAGSHIAGREAFIGRAIAAGMEVANHTMEHEPLVGRTAEYIRQELQGCEALVQAMAPGASTRPYMRPMGGIYDTWVVEVIAQEGYRPIMWNVSSGDGSPDTTVDEMVDYVVGPAHPGAIALMHFGPRLVHALPRMIAGLNDAGLEFVPLSEALLAEA